ncbi:MAG: NAD(P)-dependent oxidoreductase [Lachnospiraceae bacterium]|nr:NAD(P)-dependent oxidoreductase [Lachnospiraceae bacterium]
MELTGTRIVMTGATGFIGRHVAGELLARGVEVYALVRPESRQKELLPNHEKLHLLPGTMADAEAFVEELGHADGFLHFAWGGVNREQIDSPVVQAANVSDSLACVRAAHRLGCQVFMDAGSRVEYGITEDGSMEETMECHPVNAYGAAKLEFYQKALELCRGWKMTYYHLRFFSVYGTGDHPWSIISTLVRELPQGNTVSLSACRHRWNFMEISDAARAVAELYAHSDRHVGETQIVNIASEDTRVLKEFVEELHELCGGSGRLEYGSFVQAKEGALSICPRTEWLRRLTDNSWQERTAFAEGIRRMLAATGASENGAAVTAATGASENGAAATEAPETSDAPKAGYREINTETNGD